MFLDRFLKYFRRYPCLYKSIKHGYDVQDSHISFRNILEIKAIISFPCLERLILIITQNTWGGGGLRDRRILDDHIVFRENRRGAGVSYHQWSGIIRILKSLKSGSGKVIVTQPKSSKHPYPSPPVINNDRFPTVSNSANSSPSPTVGCSNEAIWTRKNCYGRTRFWMNEVVHF